MLKNVSGQKIHLFAFDYSTGAPKVGDAANITAYVAKDYGSATILADTSATEIDSTNAKGWYVFDLAQGETNADHLLFTAKSSTANVAIVGQSVTPISGSPRVTGTALSGSSNSIGLAASTSANQCAPGDVIVCTGGATNAGSSGIVSSVAGAGGATPVATITGTWNGTNPASGTTYEIVKVGGAVPAAITDVWNDGVVATRTITAGNVSKFNGVTVTGLGTVASPWRGA